MGRMVQWKQAHSTGSQNVGHSSKSTMPLLTGVSSGSGQLLIVTSLVLAMRSGTLSPLHCLTLFFRSSQHIRTIHRSLSTTCLIHVALLRTQSPISSSTSAIKRPRIVMLQSTLILAYSLTSQLLLPRLLRTQTTHSWQTWKHHTHRCTSSIWLLHFQTILV